MPIERNDDPSMQITADELAAMASTADQYQNSAQAADVIFKRNARLAAEQIVALATNATNETVKLNAAKYIVERVMGRVPDNKTIDGDTGAPWDGVYNSIVVREPSAIERSEGKAVERTIIEVRTAPPTT